MDVTMVAPEETLEREIAAGATQKAVAMIYAWAIRNEMAGDVVDWVRMNAAIRARWPRGLERVKRVAWRMAEGRE